MIDDRQQDLFRAPLRSTGAVVVFPLARRHDLVMRAAEGLLARQSDQGRVQFWQRTIRPFEKEMAARGLSPKAIEGELLRFKAAVAVALDVLIAVTWPRGGAA